MLLLVFDVVVGFIVKVFDMFGCVKGGKSFFMFDEGVLLLVLMLVVVDVSVVVCVFVNGCLLVFGFDEMKMLFFGGCGVNLMELEKNEKLVVV